MLDESALNKPTLCRRLALASLSHEWTTAAAADSDKGMSNREQLARAAGLELLLDAALTGWNLRDKKLGSKPMTFIRKKSFSFEAGRQNFVPIFEQSRYKYLVYVEGHCAACRYGFMMRLGSVILKVESRCVADRMWFFPLLRPYVDHVPVRADLSDLADKIRWCRRNDATCRAIARNAKNLWEAYISKRGLLDYVQLVAVRVAARYEYPNVPWLDSSSSSHSSMDLPPKLMSLQGPPLEHCRAADGLCARCADDVARERRLASLANRRSAVNNNSNTNPEDQRKRWAQEGDQRKRPAQEGAQVLRDRMKKRATGPRELRAS